MHTNINQHKLQVINCVFPSAVCVQPIKTILICLENFAFSMSSQSLQRGKLSTDSVIKWDYHHR